MDNDASRFYGIAIWMFFGRKLRKNSNKYMVYVMMKNERMGNIMEDRYGKIIF